MSILKIFRKKKIGPSSDRPYYEPIADKLKEYETGDYLGKAAEIKRRAAVALKNKEGDIAWGLYHEQKKLYLMHANRQGFSVQQTLALESQVNENMADLLRVEGRHVDALANILYWAVANQDKPIKRHAKKLESYFNRCSLKATGFKEVLTFSRTHMVPADYARIRAQVYEWRDREG